MTGKLNYYRRLFALYRSYRRRDRIVPRPPLRLWVEISSRCNLQCPICPNRDLPATGKGDMEWPLFKKIIDQGKEFAFEINLHHRGESLLHPEAGRFIRYASAQGVISKLHTNGTLLTGKMIHEVLESGLRRLSISLDGINAAEYEKNRAGARFEHVTENLSAFLRQRRQSGKKNPRLALEMIDSSSSPAETGERDEFIRRFMKMGLDELVLKQAHNWAGHLGGDVRQGEFIACTFPWNALVVFFNGDVAACAQDFFGRNRLLGNAGVKPLLEIWNDFPAQELRRAFATADIEPFPACLSCDRITRRTLAGIPREYLKRILFRRMP